MYIPMYHDLIRGLNREIGLVFFLFFPSAKASVDIDMHTARPLRPTHRYSPLGKVLRGKKGARVGEAKEGLLFC